MKIQIPQYYRCKEICTKIIQAYLLISCLFFVSAEISAQGCGCNNQVNIGLNDVPDGTTLVTRDMILEDPGVCPDAKIRLVHNQMVIEGPAPYVHVDCSLKNQYIKAEILDEYNNLLCWGWIYVEDKRNPTCYINDVTVSCEYGYSPDDLDVFGYPHNNGNPTASDNCGVTDITWEDLYTDLNPCGIGTIKRRWTVQDWTGNESHCTQWITIEDTTNPVVEWPEDVVYYCDSIGGMEPDDTGYPVFSDNCSMLLMDYEDQDFMNCNLACAKILRKWEILDWCNYDPNSGGGLFEHTQFIEVFDTLGPEITCDSSITIVTQHADCTSDIIFPAPELSDNCSPDSVLTWNMKLYDYTGNLVQPFLPADYRNLEIGTYTAIYFGRDCCGNFNRCETELVVKDGVSPVALCDNGTNVTLTNDLGGNAWATLCKDALDDGSYDNCELRDVKIRLDDTAPWTDCITLTCDDLGTNEVTLRVRDQEGNEAFCDVTVVVTDGNAPILISCAPDVTLDCGADINDPAVTGVPVFDDNCGIDDLSSTDTGDTDACSGTITRTWTGSDAGGLSASCTQVIVLGSGDGLTVTDPADITLSCANFSNDSPDVSITGDITVGTDCGGFSVEGPMDDRFIIFDDGMLTNDTIIRYWIVTDSCLGNRQDTFYQGITLEGCDDNSFTMNEIQGMVTTGYDAPIDDVMIDLDGLYDFDGMSSDDGGFAVEGYNGFPYAMTAQKNDASVAGLSTLDILLLRRHILGQAPLDNPYKIIAADLNLSNSITSLDIILLRQKLLQNAGGINTPGWRFMLDDNQMSSSDPLSTMNDSYSFTLNSNLYGLNFKGVKLGDLNWSLADDISGSSDDRNAANYYFNIENQSVKAGEYFTVDFDLNTVIDIAGFQMTIAFNTEQAVFTNIEYSDMINISNGNFGLNFARQGMIASSWDNISQGDKPFGKKAFSLTFKAISNLTVKEFIGINSQIVKSEAYKTENLEQLAIGLKFGGEDNTMLRTEEYTLFQNSPNPFKQNTTISFILPEAEAVELVFHGVDGKVLDNVHLDGVKGFNEYQFKTPDGKNGLIFYQLKTANYSATKRMIMTK